MSKPHQKLIAWRKAMDLVEKIYELTRRLSRAEIYGLKSQLRRAAISVPSNIAEGVAGRSSIQFRNYLAVAIGSLNELGDPNRNHSARGIRQFVCGYGNGGC